MGWRNDRFGLQARRQERRRPRSAHRAAPDLHTNRVAHSAGKILGEHFKAFRLRLHFSRLQSNRSFSKRTGRGAAEQSVSQKEVGDGGAPYLSVLFE